MVRIITTKASVFACASRQPNGQPVPYACLLPVSCSSTRDAATSSWAGQEVAQMSSLTPPSSTDDTPIGPDVDLKRDDVRLKDGTRLTDEIVD